MRSASEAGSTTVSESAKVAAVEVVGIIIVANAIVTAIIVDATAEIAVSVASVSTVASIAFIAIITISSASCITARIASTIANMPDYRTAPIPRIVVAAPAIIPRGVPASIPAAVTIIPWIIPRVEPRIIPAGIIAVAPRIVPAPHAAAPVVRTVTIIIVEPWIIESVPSAHLACAYEILIPVSILLGEVSIIINAVGRHTLAHMELDNVVAQGIFPYILIMAEDSAASIVFINRTVASAPIQAINTISTRPLFSILALEQSPSFSLFLGLLLRIEVEVIVLCHRSEWHRSCDKDCKKILSFHILFSYLFFPIFLFPDHPERVLF